MILRCPSCGREGNVPDRLGGSTHSVRCRPCGARFSTAPARVMGEAHPQGPSVARGVGSHASKRPVMVARGFSAGSDPDLAEYPQPSPEDSQHEMAAVLGGDPDDSQVELPAFVLADGPSGEYATSPGLQTGSSEFLLAVPWYFRFIESWGRVHVFVAVGFAAASLSVLGFLLIRALVAGHTLNSSITALIVGCVGTIAFLLLSLSATVLIMLLIDLARNVRLLIQQTDLHSGPIDSRNQTPTSLSQPVG